MRARWMVGWSDAERAWEVTDSDGARMALVPDSMGAEYDILYELHRFEQTGREVEFTYRDGSHEVRVV